MPHILLVDDDPAIRQVLGFALEKEGYTVHEADNGRAALESCAAHTPDLMVLDIMMPELDGTQVCQQLRAGSVPALAQLPILFLSAKDDELDRILGLEIGGDDYLTKPFSPREVVARVKALLRRAQHTHTPAASDAAQTQTLTRSGLVLNFQRYEIGVEGGATPPTPLTMTEFGLLRTLMNAPGKVFNRDELMQQAYDIHKIVSDRTIDSHIRRVRGKLQVLGVDPIETLHGIGYRWK